MQHGIVGPEGRPVYGIARFLLFWTTCFGSQFMVRVMIFTLILQAWVAPLEDSSPRCAKNCLKTNPRLENEHG